jgi:hypothetical protein
MNLFDKAKSEKKVAKCKNCTIEFKPDKRNLNRGWGLCCSKSCATTFKNKLRKLSGPELTKELRDLRLSQLGL